MITSFAINNRDFNSYECENIRKYLDKKFSEIEKEIGLKLSLGNIKYTLNNFHTVLTVVKPKNNTERLLSARELEVRANISKHGWKHNITEKYLDTKVKINNKVYTVIGCSNRYCKKPLIVKDDNSQFYNISLNYYKTFFC